MISILKQYTLADIKNKMILLYALNITDIVFTLLLCSTGYFIEANPIVAVVTGNTVLAVLVKCVVPASVLFFLYMRIRTATLIQLKRTNTFIVVLLFFYVFINISHIVWLSIMIIKPSLLASLI